MLDHAQAGAALFFSTQALNLVPREATCTFSLRMGWPKMGSLVSVLTCRAWEIPRGSYLRVMSISISLFRTVDMLHARRD
jgi:hypothetical protein